MWPVWVKSWLWETKACWQRWVGHQPHSLHYCSSSQPHTAQVRSKGTFFACFMVKTEIFRITLMLSLLILISSKSLPHIFHFLFTCTSALSMVHLAPAELMLAERNTDGKIEDVPDKVSNVVFLFYPESICSALFYGLSKVYCFPSSWFYILNTHYSICIVYLWLSMCINIWCNSHCIDSKPCSRTTVIYCTLFLSLDQ